jgi:hypothetical protein
MLLDEPPTGLVYSNNNNNKSGNNNNNDANDIISSIHDLKGKAYRLCRRVWQIHPK